MNDIIIYKTQDKKTEIQVNFVGDTVWLTQAQMAELFGTDRTSILKHIQNIYFNKELEENSTCEKFAQVREEGKRIIKRQILHYNLDAIISVGYRVNSKRGTQFRQWATQRLKDYLVQGYAINEKRLAEKQQQVEYLKTGIRILSRAITQQATAEDSEMLQIFAKGLELLDDYDHEQLDTKGKTIKKTVYPEVQEYFKVIAKMKSNFASDVFAKPKDNSFESSVKQIAQSFAKKELYPSIEEKAATLLYLIVKNHAFVDGNKRIAAACFLHFLEKNGILYSTNSTPIISNEALAALTLFVATSKPEEMETVKKFIISILNRNK
ncbi:MAG TPA: death-on-curing protein [Bacteroidetes bacterium]|nr:death-on-curing protein [Bacteroidota bacterium]HCN37519.1 death-on-curing protein [Bacteroidota bacterium]